MLANISDKSAPRGFSWIWFIRFAQLVLSMIVLGLAAWNISDLKSLHCDAPSKMAFNVACAVISIFVTAYLILSTGPSNMFKVLPWLVWGQIALDGVMFVFWIAATATSPFTINDLVDACINAYVDDFSNYDPYDNSYYGSSKRDLSLVPRKLTGLLEPRRTRYSSSRGSSYHTAGSVNARTAMDSLLVVLFFITLASTVWWVVKEGNHHFGSAAPTTQPQAHDDLHGPTGLPTVTPKEPTVTYSQPQMQQSQFYQMQPQPSPSPSPAPAVYNQSVPQAQYTQQHSGY